MTPEIRKCDYEKLKIKELKLESITDRNGVTLPNSGECWIT